VRADIYQCLRNVRKYRFCFHNHPHIYHTFVSVKNANQTVLPDKRASNNLQHLVMTMRACRKYQVISRIVMIPLHREHWPETEQQQPLRKHCQKYLYCRMSQHTPPKARMNSVVDENRWCRLSWQTIVSEKGANLVQNSRSTSLYPTNDQEWIRIMKWLYKSVVPIYQMITLRCVIPVVCVTNEREESVVNQHN